MNVSPGSKRTDAKALMERETRVAYGAVPRRLFGDPLPPVTYQMLGEGFLLRGEGSHYFYYSKGDGIVVERGPDADLSEESLWLNGTLYSAIASLNGLIPIHASAVVADGKVFAFTAPAGGGKSTLAAALSARGLPLFCDDTLILDLSDPMHLICLPGHKRLKLRPDALTLTGAVAEERVSTTVEKSYARPATGPIAAPLPLAQLIFLENGPDIAITAIDGGERIVKLQDDHLTSQLFAFAHKLDRAARFEHLCRLANSIQIRQFVRPRDPARFAEGVDHVVDYLNSESSL